MTSSDQVEERHRYFSIIFFAYREMRFPNHQRQISPVSVWPLVLLNVASTNFTTQRVETASRRTVIWNVSLVLHGHWWCHGVLVIAGLLLLPNFLSSIIPQWTRTPKTGIFTAYKVWCEWDHCRLTLPTGEQHAATRLTASISETTSAETTGGPDVVCVTEWIY